REQRTAALYAMSRELASTRGVDALLTVVVRHISEVFHGGVALLLPEGDDRLVAWPGGQYEVDGNELGVGRWVYEHRQLAGLGTSTLPGASALYCLSLPRQAPWACSACGPPILTHSTRPNSSTSSKRSRTRSRWPSSGRIWPTRLRTPRCASRPSVFATRC